MTLVQIPQQATSYSCPSYSLFFQGAEIRDSEICRRPEARSEFVGSLHRVLVGGIATALVQSSP